MRRSTVLSLSLQLAFPAFCNGALCFVSLLLFVFGFHLSTLTPKFSTKKRTKKILFLNVFLKYFVIYSPGPNVIKLSLSVIF
jgi:hypothetical protein